MYYEEVRVAAGETLSGLIVAYGHMAGAWPTTWNNPRNAALAARRGAPENLQVGDVVWISIPWQVVSHVLTRTATGAHFVVRRDGGRGTRLNWVQTIDQGNQPAAGSTEFIVDPTPGDDALPFYYTDADFQLDADFRRVFDDAPARPAPGAAMGTTRWRATVSIAVCTNTRVTIFDSWAWGFNRDTHGHVATMGPRPATPHEVHRQLMLLVDGHGTLPGTFGHRGWTFRTPP